MDLLGSAERLEPVGTDEVNLHAVRDSPAHTPEDCTRNRQGSRT